MIFSLSQNKGFFLNIFIKVFYVKYIIHIQYASIKKKFRIKIVSLDVFLNR